MSGGGADARISLSRGPWLSWLERSVHIRKVTGSSPVGPISPETLAGTFKEPGKTLGFSGFFFGLTPAFDVFPRSWGYWWVRNYRHRLRVFAGSGSRCRSARSRIPCQSPIPSVDLSRRMAIRSPRCFTEGGSPKQSSVAAVASDPPISGDPFLSLNCRDDSHVPQRWFDLRSHSRD